MEVIAVVFMICITIIVIVRMTIKRCVQSTIRKEVNLKELIDHPTVKGYDVSKLIIEGGNMRLEYYNYDRDYGPC